MAAAALAREPSREGDARNLSRRVPASPAEADQTVSDIHRDDTTSARELGTEA
jgi:hypothetical protein